MSSGSVDNPSWGQLDLRVQYIADFGRNLVGEFFLDVFNVANNQGPRRTMDLVAGEGGNAFGDDVRWVNPRRLFLGAHLRLLATLRLTLRFVGAFGPPLFCRSALTVSKLWRRSSFSLRRDGPPTPQKPLLHSFRSS